MNTDNNDSHRRAPPPGPFTARPVTLRRCENGHAFFFSHQSCPRCAAPLTETESSPEAVLVSHTTVRVGPGATPFGLCLARVAGGAQTLCIMDGDFGSEPASEVVIEKRGGLYHARPKTSP